MPCSISMLRDLRIKAPAIAFLALLLGACAGPSNQQFEQLASSGIAFTDGLGSVYEYAWKEAVQASNKQFVKDHKAAMADRQTAGRILDAGVANLAANNQALIERRKVFAEMTRQAGLLNDYFKTIQVLAGGSEAEAAGQAANASALALGQFVNEFKSPIGKDKQPVNQIIEGVTKLAVGEFSNAKLRENLEHHGDVVLGSLRSQLLMLENLQANVTAAGAQDGLASVAATYKTPGTLVADWGSQRLAALSYTPPPSPVSAAITAARQLEANFKGLVEGQANALDKLQKAVVLTNTLIDLYEGQTSP